MSRIYDEWVQLLPMCDKANDWTHVNGDKVMVVSRDGESFTAKAMNGKRHTFGPTEATWRFYPSSKHSFPFKLGGSVNFRGATAAHWKQEADKSVVRSLLHAADSMDIRSIIGAISTVRLYKLAKDENPKLVKELEEQHSRIIETMGMAIAAFTKSGKLVRGPKKPGKKSRQSARSGIPK